MKTAPVILNSEETLERLIDMTNQSNKIALDKALQTIYSAKHTGYAAAAARVNSIAERCTRAAFEVGMTLPAELRATDKKWSER